MFPLSASTLSLKFKTIFASLAIAVALSAGVDELKVGAVVSGVVTTRSKLFPEELTKLQLY